MIDISESERCLFHITDDEIFTELAEYVKANGTLNKEDDFSKAVEGSVLFPSEFVEEVHTITYYDIENSVYDFQKQDITDAELVRKVCEELQKGKYLPKEMSESEWHKLVFFGDDVKKEILFLGNAVKIDDVIYWRFEGDSLDTIPEIIGYK